VWDGEVEEGGAAIGVGGYGKWKRREAAAASVGSSDLDKLPVNADRRIPDQINDLSVTPYPSLNLAFSLDLSCAQQDPRPELEDVESLVLQFIARYACFVYELLFPMNEKGAADRTSLIGPDCNPRLFIHINHPLHKQQTVRIIAATNGESVEVLYDDIADESGRMGCCQRYAEECGSRAAVEVQFGIREGGNGWWTP
jgi:hypothetical protein